MITVVTVQVVFLHMTAFLEVGFQYHKHLHYKSCITMATWQSSCFNAHIQNKIHNIIFLVPLFLYWHICTVLHRPSLHLGRNPRSKGLLIEIKISVLLLKCFCGYYQSANICEYFWQQIIPNANFQTMVYW